MESEYYKYINQTVFEEFNFTENRPNELMLAMGYSFNLSMDNNYSFWKIAEFILKKNSKSIEKVKIFNRLMTSFYCIMTSFDINYSLICNNINKFSKFNLFFGENISQLCSVILLSNAISIINKTFDNYQDKLKVVKFFETELNNLKKSDLILKLEFIDKKILQKEYEDSHFKFFRFSILIINYILNSENKTITDDTIIKLYRFSFNKYNGRT